jgi:hypothetical protein
MTTHDFFLRRASWILLCSLILISLALFLPSGAFKQASAEADEGQIGFLGPSSGSVYAPTASEMQSKLWFNDGTWWGSLYNQLSGQFEIFRYDAATRSWITTSNVIDKRKVSRADCLWDGNHLFVVSAARLGSNNSDKSIRILRYRYDPATKQYLLDDGFPVLLASQPTYGIVIDQDTTGALWAAYTAENGSGGGSVFISHSNPDGTQWNAPAVLPVSGAANLLVEDIASLVAYDGKIGLMWSNQNDHAMYYATHKDGDPGDVWQRITLLQGNLLADNHIHLKAVHSGSDGRVYAAVKTSLNDQTNADPNAPLVMLLQINPDGSWTQRTFGRVSERHTRPMILIDDEHHTLYMFATSFCCGNAKIFYKQLSLEDANAQFSPGLGDVFIDFGTTSDINNVTSMKQTVNSERDIFVMAEDGAGGSYVYNSIDLKPALPPTPAPTETPVARVMMPIILLDRPQTP